MSAQIESMYRGVNEREKDILDIVLTSLDELANTIRELHDEVNGGNGHDANGDGTKPPRANGHDVKKDRPSKTARTPKAAQDKSTSR